MDGAASSYSTDDWLASLRAPASAEGRAALVELQDYLRRVLAKGFGTRLNDADLDDVSQEALVKIITKLDAFAGRSKFTTWAVSIAVNTALDTLRRRKHQHISVDDALAQTELRAQGPSPASNVHQGELNTLVANLIGEVLSERQAVALRMELAGLPAAEVAERLQMTPGALYKLLHDARKKLKRALMERGISPLDLMREGE